jgi:hypothetical protein
MSDPEHNPQFRRVWTEPEKPPPKRKRPALVAFESQPPQSFPKPNDTKNIRTATTVSQRELPGTKKHIPAPRSKTRLGHKRRQPNFERFVKMAHKFLAPERRS